jgi:nicotinate-nucleotide adenylyltransferase
MRVGVLGGSFNPVHLGHLYIAQLAREAGPLDRIVFVPAAEPPHKSPTDLAPAKDRLAMLRAALGTEPSTSISGIELETGGPRYTIETLARLQKVHPDARLAFIMGLDSLQDFPGWREPERILNEHEVISVDRPGLSMDDVDPAWAGRVTLVEGNPFAISSSDIRRRVGAGRTIRHLVSAGVAAYIAENMLYRRSEV